jgi:hypothetical protein
MATATLEFDCPQGGTLTVELYPPGSDTATTSVAATERTNDKGCYTASLVDVASGTYKARFRNASNATIARALLQHVNEAGVERVAMDDQASIADPTATVNLSGTTVGTVNALAADSVNASALATSAVTEIQSGLSTVSAADVWGYASRTLTQGAAAVTAAVTGATITVYRGTTWSISLTDVGSLTGWTKLYFTVRADKDAADSTSLLQVMKTNPSDAVNDGLQYFGGASATKANGSLTVDDTATGDITISINTSVTNSVVPQRLAYDIKKISASGATLMSSGGEFVIEHDVTRAVS